MFGLDQQHALLCQFHHEAGKKKYLWASLMKSYIYIQKMEYILFKIKSNMYIMYYICIHIHPHNIYIHRVTIILLSPIGKIAKYFPLKFSMLLLFKIN